MPEFFSAQQRSLPASPSVSFLIPRVTSSPCLGIEAGAPVSEAARALLSPTTDPFTRTAASAFLEQWVSQPTVKAWDEALQWLQAAATASSVLSSSSPVSSSPVKADDATASLLLCLQLLQSKIRKHVTVKDNNNQNNSYPEDPALPPLLNTLEGQLGSLVTQSSAALHHGNASSSSPAASICTSSSICLVALGIRCGHLNALMDSGVHAAASSLSMETPTFGPWKVLQNVPLEAEACREWTTSQVAAHVTPYIPRVLEAIRCALTQFCQSLSTTQSSDPQQYTLQQTRAANLADVALQTLHTWTASSICSITLSLYQSSGVLPVLVHILSQSRQHMERTCGGTASIPVIESIWVHASQAIQGACTEVSEEEESTAMACRQYVLDAVVNQGCLAIPLQSCSTKSSPQEALGDLSYLLDTWSNVIVTLSTSFLTVATEHVEQLVRKPAHCNLIQFVLFLQNHPLPKASMTCLEFWLAVLEVPTAERHEDWKQPLFCRLVQILQERLSMWNTALFLMNSDYDDDNNNTNRNALQQTIDLDDVDETEVAEFRRLAQDVFVGAYCFLRSDYISLIVVEKQLNNRNNNNNTQQQAYQQHWTSQEVAWQALTAPAREINARMKQRRLLGGSGAVDGITAADRQQTTQLLLQLLQSFCLFNLSSNDPSSNQQQQQQMQGQSQQQNAALLCQQTHPRVLIAKVDWIGALAPAWAGVCPPAAIWQLVMFCQMATTTASQYSRSSETVTTCRRAAAKSIRSLFVHASSILRKDASSSVSNRALLDDQFKQLMQAVLMTHDEETMVTVAEGCTRLLVHDIPTASTTGSAEFHAAALGASLINLVEPVLQQGAASLQALDERTAPEQEALESFSRCLHVLQVIVRFCDVGGSGAASAAASNNNNNNHHPMANVLTTIWPFLETASTRAVQYPFLLDKVLAIHEQLLKNVPDLLAPYFENTIKYAVATFECTKHAACLVYMTRAVEVYGSSSANAFQELLTHVANITFAHVGGTKQGAAEECVELIAAFFELNQRYILYCPSALLQSQQFASIVACAVECLQLCRGERESTRATLIFLTQLFGWRSLRLSVEAQTALQQSSHRMDELLAQHGARLVKSCMATLMGGPQMLYGACSDCLLAVLSPAAQWVVPMNGDGNSYQNEQQQQQQSNVARQWMEAAKPSLTTATPSSPTYGAADNYDDSIYFQVVAILLALTNQGPKSKPKAKMLLSDYCKIAKGEMAADALVTYSLA